jgi:hypothetical protein
METETFIGSMGHQQQESADGPRHLIFGPIVPKNEVWTLELLVAKNNMIPDHYPTNRVTAELSVCVYLPRPSTHEETPPGTWVLLGNDVGVPQFKSVKWEGFLVLPPSAQLGAWFRGAEEGDIVELNALYNIDCLDS